MVEEFLCGILRRETLAWPHAAGAAFAADFVEQGSYHGVLPLVHDRLQRAPAPGWPTQVLQACRDHALSQAMAELRDRALLTQVLARLATINVRPVLFKGTALAYTIYPGSALRPRSDTDLIIPLETLPDVTATLAALGFTRPPDPSREFTFYQASFVRHEQGGPQALDVHWRITNAELLSRLFSYQELLLRACPVPRLGPDALAAGTVDALLLACLHRAVHHCVPYYVDGVARYDDRLIWLYDIHLLAGSLAQPDWDELIGQARDKGLLAVCLEGLERARHCFDTAVPEPALAALRRPQTPEVVASYFRGGPVRQQWMDFRAIAGATNKLRFLAELAFPPTGYMRAKYPEARSQWLAWLYVRRVSGGVLRRIHGRPQAP